MTGVAEHGGQNNELYKIIEILLYNKKTCNALIKKNYYGLLL